VRQLRGLDAVTQPVWATPPARPQLSDGVLDVWRAELDALGDAASGLISPEERARADGFVAEIHRRRWARARGALRALVGAYLEVDPRVP
jgi:hypothetical protein